MPDKIDQRVKKERSERLLKLAEESARSFRERFVGHTMMVLWEQEVQEGTWVGLTDNYIRVIARSEEPLRNSLIPASLGNEHYHCLGANIAQ
jgi:threonylcarbamoyladenosine tRNA methylthiotransferase MtaB